MKVPHSLSAGPLFSFAQRLREVSLFFEKSDRVHQTMRRVAARLGESGTTYAIVGGMAVNAHHHERTTRDVDFLLTPKGFLALRALLAAGEFDAIPGRLRRFVDPKTGVPFAILLTGMFPGSGAAGPIAFPDPVQVSQTQGDLSVVNLFTLIELKLAAHRYQDFADVVSLIRANQLDESFADHIHPSVRGDYSECLEEMRREAEYEARQDQAFEAGQGGE